MHQSYKMKENDDKYRLNKSLNIEGDGLFGNPFSVPDGYFGELEARTLFYTRISSEKNTGMNVPAGYFEQLEGDILSRISEEKLRQSVNSDGFAVPPAYFEGLQAQILAAVNPQKPKETIIRKLIGSAGMKYAAAACVLFASVFMIKDSLLQSGNPLADIPEQELIQYLQLYGNTQDAMMFREHASMDRNLADLDSEISSSDIEWYLDNTW